MPATEIEIDTVLFDMDGLHNAHGHRTVENLARYIPGLQGSKLEEEVKRFESRILEIAEAKINQSETLAQEKAISEGRIVALPGAKQLIDQISAGKQANPARRAGWAIVTSATSAYAQRAYELAGLGTPPTVFVTGDMVKNGKPAPEPYERAAALSQVADIHRCLVVEDAPPGVTSGKAAGAYVLGLETTHDGRRMWANGANWVVKDLSKVQARWEGDKLLLTIDSEPKP
ncbi:hypothetical protein CBS9595_003095 [Malassezia furfur]|nr:hypothetical protein CBS9595_003095 [Malassezia furfur]